jgi:hypothetical protein
VKEITINGTNHTVEYTGEDVPGEDLEFMGKRRGNIRGWRNNFFVEIPTGQSRYGDRRGAAVNPTASRFSERKGRGMRRSGMWGWRGAAVDPIIRNCELVLREGGERDEEVGASGVAAAAMREEGGTGRGDWSYAGFCVFADCRQATRRDCFTPLEKHGRPDSVLRAYYEGQRGGVAGYPAPLAT